MPRQHYPNIHALTEVQIARLRTLPEGPLPIEVQAQFEDDHRPCLDLKIAGVKLSIWWLGDEAAAAFYFHDDSPRARAMFPALVRDAAFPDNPFAR